MDPESRAIVDQLVRRIYNLETRMAQMEGRTYAQQPPPGAVYPVTQPDPEQMGMPQQGMPPEMLPELALDLSDPSGAYAQPALPLPVMQDASPGPTAYSQTRPDGPQYAPPSGESYQPGPPVYPPIGVPPGTVPPIPIPPIPVPPNVETQAGLIWVNRIGAITLILGAAFFFKYAVDNDWIGPAGRVIVGVLMAMLALAGGDRLWHRGHKAFAQGITALGICTLFLSFWAAFGLYKLIPQTLAFGLMVTATAASGALAIRYNARIIAILALAGGYLTPFLVSTGEPNDLFFGSYLVAVNLIAVSVARRQGWRSVEIIALAGTIILHAIWYSERPTQIGKLAGVAFTLCQLAIFGVTRISWQSVTAQIFAAIGVAAFFRQQWDPNYFAAAGLVAVAGIVWAAIRKSDVPISGALAGWIFGMSAWAGPIIEHPTQTFLASAIAFLVFLAAVLFIRVEKIGIATFGTIGVNGIVFFGISAAVLEKDFHGYLGMLAVAVAASYLLAAMVLRNSGNPRGAMFGAGLALAFLTLAIPVQLTGYSITIGWAIEAAALAWIAWRLNSGWAAGGSWFVAFLVLMRLALVDLDSYWPAQGEDYTLFVNARFLPFLSAAISYMLVAYFATKTTILHKNLAILPVMAAHFVLLWGLHLEAFAYVGATHESGSDTTSLKALISTILLAVYGLAMIGIGISRSETFHRLLGLLLFALVILKLYFFDVWLMGTGFRILAFVGLGGLLLAGSFLYSRYRDRIAALWKVRNIQPDETPTA